ncbi:hypothetical protein ACWGLF_23435 [Streptomyces puniciscabiei]
MIQRSTAIAVLASPLLLTGCGGGAEATERRTPPTRPAPTATPEVQAAQTPQGIPGLGSVRSAATPERCGQAVVVTGRGEDSPLCTVVLHRRTATGRPPGPAWPALPQSRLRSTGGTTLARRTHGCVSVAKAHMKELLRTLDPGRHPVVVMGHADWLAARAA